LQKQLQIDSNECFLFVSRNCQEAAPAEEPMESESEESDVGQ